MYKFLAFLEKTVMPVAAKVGQQRHLQAIRDGIILAMPLIIVGSLFLILAFLPITGYEDFMAGIFGDEWQKKLLYPQPATFGMLGLIASVGVAYRLAEHYKIDALSSGVISMCAFLLATPFVGYLLVDGTTAIKMADGASVVSSVIPVALMGSEGLFVAMLIAILSTEVYRWVVKKNFVIKMPAGVPPAVSKSFIAIVPAFLVIMIVWILRLTIEYFDIGSVHQIVGLVLGKPLELLGTSLGGSLVAVFLVSIFWSVGLHGMNLVNSVMSPIWLKNSGANQAAYMANEELPHIFTSTFFDIFVNIGGSGATFGLVLLMLFWAKSKQMKQLGKLSIGPGTFMINEPVVFGSPIVMNPLLIVPFVLVPLVNVLVTYFAMSVGWVALPTGVIIPWTTPPVIGGYLATGGSISGGVMQLFNILLGLLIYLPFFHMWDRMKKREEAAEENAET